MAFRQLVKLIYDMEDPMKKVTVNLPTDQVDFLMSIAKKEHLTFTDVLRRSIRSEQFFVEQAEIGNKILVEDHERNIYQILRK